MRATIRQLNSVSLLRLLRRKGYWIVRATDEMEAVRPWGRKRFPRFHLKIYPKSSMESFLDLHVDWERPKHSPYWGQCSTEDDKMVEEEMKILEREIASLQEE